MTTADREVRGVVRLLLEPLVSAPSGRVRFSPDRSVSSVRQRRNRQPHGPDPMTDDPWPPKPPIPGRCEWWMGADFCVRPAFDGGYCEHHATMAAEEPHA